MNDARFPDRVSQRFLAIDVLAQLERRERGKGVRVLGAAHHDGIDILRVVVEFTEVDMLASLWKLLGRSLKVALVHVAQGDDVLGANLGEVPGAATTATDDGDVQPIIWRTGPENGGKADEEGTGRNAGRSEKLAAGVGVSR